MGSQIARTRLHGCGHDMDVNKGGINCRVILHGLFCDLLPKPIVTWHEDASEAMGVPLEAF